MREHIKRGLSTVHMLLFELIWALLRPIIAPVNSTALLSSSASALPTSNCSVIAPNIAGLYYRIIGFSASYLIVESGYSAKSSRCVDEEIKSQPKCLNIIHFL